MNGILSPTYVVVVIWELGKPSGLVYLICKWPPEGIFFHGTASLRSPGRRQPGSEDGPGPSEGPGLAISTQGSRFQVKRFLCEEDSVTSVGISVRNHRGTFATSSKPSALKTRPFPARPATILLLFSDSDMQENVCAGSWTHARLGKAG